MPKRHIRIALFVCDTPNEFVVAKHGDYVPIFDALLADSLSAAGRQDEVDYAVEPYDVVNGELPDLARFEKGAADAYDGILMTGSAACAYDDDAHPWVPPTLWLLREVGDNQSHVKIIGICFGLQLLVRAYGGTVSRNPLGWEIGTYTLDCTPEGHELFGTPSINIQQMHADHATGLPPDGSGWELLASTDKSLVHALASRYPDGKVHFLAIQGHPEFNASIVNLVIDVRSNSGLFTPEMASEARRRSVQPEDGKGKWGAVMWRVLLGEI